MLSTRAGITRRRLVQHMSFYRVANRALIVPHTRQSPISFWTRSTPVEPEPIIKADTPTAAAAVSPEKPPATPDIHPLRPRRRRRHTKLTPEKRQERFDQLFDFIAPRLGRRPAVKTPQVRQSAWTHLFGLATTAGQLEKVVALFPRWRDSNRVFDAQHAEQFVRGCLFFVLSFNLSKYPDR